VWRGKDDCRMTQFDTKLLNTGGEGSGARGWKGCGITRKKKEALGKTNKRECKVSGTVTTRKATAVGGAGCLGKGKSRHRYSHN